MQRYIFAIALVLMIVFVIFASFFFIPKLFSFGTAQAAPTPTLVPSPTATPTPTPSPTPQATVQQVRLVSTYLMDAASGKVLLNTAGDMRFPMASTVKVMTAVLALEHLNTTDMFTIYQSELDEIPPGGFTIAYLHPGDNLSVLDLLYGLLLPSGCDAAIVLAHAVSGNTASFVSLMNTRARELGMNNTHFVDPAGFSDSDYSTVTDLTKLARYAMSLPTFAQIVSQPSKEFTATLSRHDYNWQNTNQLLSLYPNANGIKTGNSDGAGYCLVFSAARNGHLLVGAILHDDSWDDLYQDASSALDTGFAKV